MKKKISLILILFLVSNMLRGEDFLSDNEWRSVPQYIKQLPDYKEILSKSAGTYYADWSNTELQRFTFQFYTDFLQKYAQYPRPAFMKFPN